MYRSGRQNVKADSLSRNPSLPGPPVGDAETDVQVAMATTGGGYKQQGSICNLMAIQIKMTYCPNDCQSL